MLQTEQHDYLFSFNNVKFKVVVKKKEKAVEYIKETWDKLHHLQLDRIAKNPTFHENCNFISHLINFFIRDCLVYFFV